MKIILFVEDSPNDLELALEALSKEAFARHIVVAKDGQQALDYLYCAGSHADRESGNPILIMLDIKLPRVDGLEVLRHVKADPELKSIPIVMFTGSGEESDLKMSYGLGANGYVVKPIDFEEYGHVLKVIGEFWAKINQAPPDRALTS